jgi:hypothetical protein
LIELIASESFLNLAELRDPLGFEWKKPMNMVVKMEDFKHCETFVEDYGIFKVLPWHGILPMTVGWIIVEYSS